MPYEEKALAEPLLPIPSSPQIFADARAPVDPLQGSHEDLLAMQRMLGSPRSALASRLGGAFADPTPVEGERALPVPKFSER